MSSFANYFFSKCIEVMTNQQFDIEKMVKILNETRINGGRVFFAGNGGSAGNSSHAVNDFRKIAGIESYSITDNVSELTARINDDGFDYCFDEWLAGSRLNKNDVLFVLSVGGGNKEKNISNNVVRAIDYAKIIKSKVVGICGRDGGYLGKMADCAIIIPTVDEFLITPIVESFQSIVLHIIVSHPSMKKHETKWESTK